MMKKLLILVVVVLVLGVGYMAMQKKSPSTDNAMPVVGASGVEETVVEESPKVAKKFTLDGFEFGFDQKTITVKKGDTVEITLTNSGKMSHDWIVDEFTGAKTKQIKNGETDTISFVADTAGTFEYYCGVGQHRKNGMVGKLIVE